MPFANHTPYDYIPRRLHPQEIGNPFHVINRFFGWENFPEWRIHLDNWRDHAINSGYQMNNERTLQTFVRYEFMEILIEGLFMLQRIHSGKWLPEIELYHSFDTHNEKETALEGHMINKALGYNNNYFAPKTFELKDYQLIYLDHEERKHPMTVVSAIFKNYTLPHLRDALYWWLVVSMDYTSAGDSRGEKYLSKLHQHLQKTIEAAHLIYIWNADKLPELYP